jgi:hypothetical protein
MTAPTPPCGVCAPPPSRGVCSSPPPLRGEVPSPFRGEGPSPLRGEAPSPLRGEGPSPLRGEDVIPVGMSVRACGCLRPSLASGHPSGKQPHCRATRTWLPSPACTSRTKAISPAWRPRDSSLAETIALYCIELVNERPTIRDGPFFTYSHLIVVAATNMLPHLLYLRYYIPLLDRFIVFT